MDKEKILNLLICPKCQKRVRTHDMFIVCEKCKLAYPVIDGTPDMLISDAWKLAKAKKAKFKHDKHLE